VLKQAIDQDMRYVISGVSKLLIAITDAVGKHNAGNPDRASCSLIRSVGSRVDGIQVQFLAFPV